MACFTVSMIGAIGVGVAKHIVKHHEKKIELQHQEPKEYKFGSDVKWSKKLSYLELTLWTGSFLLAGEHILHGEVVPYPPFLTAMNSAEDTMEMLQEMGTVGVLMFVLLVVAWAVGVLIVDFVKFRKHKEIVAKENE
ncbi:MAG: hypothetical protein IJQ67_06565 [Bacilli bacterium]|nr:hypothetical protein [Bacilli bacterium]